MNTVEYWDTGEYREYSRILGIQENTGNTGEYREYRRIPGMQENTVNTGEYRKYRDFSCW